MGCPQGCVTSKSLCRIYGFLSVFFGLIFLYYWQLLFIHSTRISKAQEWNTLLPLNNNHMTEVIQKKCGNDYLEQVTPYKFGTQFQRALEMFVASAIILSMKGVVQFFMTCLDPRHARSVSFTVLFIDLIATGVLLVGLYLFRSPHLCLLEFTGILHYPHQQTLVTIVLLLALTIIKIPEIIATILFIREQHILLLGGETRSKGVRRSEAFVTPNSSRVNSYLGILKTRPGLLKKYQSNDPKVSQALMNSQQGTSDDESEPEYDDASLKSKASFSIVIEPNSVDMEKFEEIDLNDNLEYVRDIKPTEHELNLDESSSIHAQSKNNGNEQKGDFEHVDEVDDGNRNPPK